MKFKLKISPEAQKDINKALDYYDNINIKLGIELFNIIFENLEFIQNKPFSFTTKYKNIRTFPIKKYPYIICYFIDEQNSIVNVISVFHTKQNPNKLKQK